jgi:hypothetical protein
MARTKKTKKTPFNVGDRVVRNKAVGSIPQRGDMVGTILKVTAAAHSAGGTRARIRVRWDNGHEASVEDRQLVLGDEVAGKLQGTSKAAAPRKKSARQLEAEINEVLNGGDNGSRRHATKKGNGLKLTENQKMMLRMAHERSDGMSSGRYGWNEMHVRALEKKGLVTLVSSHTWDKNWKLTELGRETAKTLHAEWLEQVK